MNVDNSSISIRPGNGHGAIQPLRGQLPGRFGAVDRIAGPPATRPRSPVARLATTTLLAALSACAGAWRAAAGTIEQVGTGASWPTTWKALGTQNEVNDSVAEQLDFVGDSSNPWGYVASNSEYVFFRQRVDIGTVGASTFGDAHFVLIDVVGNDSDVSTTKLKTSPTDDHLPDYAFAWDSKSNDNAKHGLEMQIRTSAAVTSWDSVRMDDIDGDPAAKLTADINGGSRTGDGYVRTIDGQSTTAFGLTTFIDYAVKWSYLETYTGLARGQSWRVAFGSIANATDHNAISADVAGGANPASLVTLGWASVSISPTSSGIDLRAFQGADGVYVEFMVYDVESEGIVTLTVLGADGNPVWTGTADVVASAEQVCRFLVPGLAVGGIYDFAVRDEVGTGWSAPGVTVSAFATELIRMSPSGTTLSFNSLPGRQYEIQWIDRMGAAWQPVTTVLADNDRTSVFVSCPEPKATAGFFRVRLK